MVVLGYVDLVGSVGIERVARVEEVAGDVIVLRGDGFRGLLDVGGLPHAREVGEVGHLLLVGVLEDGLEALHRAERRAEQEARRVDGSAPGVAVVDDGARGEDRISVRVGAVREEVHQTGRVEPAARFVVQVAALLLRVGEVCLLGEPFGDVGPDVS